jgi:hypothetical protein
MNGHCEERFVRPGNLDVADFMKTEIASLAKTAQRLFQ